MAERFADYITSLNLHRDESIQVRLLGVLPLTFFLVQGIHYWRINELGNMLWMCNMGNLVLALGLFLANAPLIRISVIWMIPGFVVWFVYVVWAWGAFLSSTLAHVGGLAVGIVALTSVGMDSRAWLYSFLWYLGMQGISRVFTPANLNVNVAHSIDPWWQGAFNSYWKFWIVLAVATAGVLWLVGQVLMKLFPARMTRTAHDTIPQH